VTRHLVGADLCVCPPLRVCPARAHTQVRPYAADPPSRGGRPVCLPSPACLPSPVCLPLRRRSPPNSFGSGEAGTQGGVGLHLHTFRSRIVTAESDDWVISNCLVAQTLVQQLERVAYQPHWNISVNAPKNPRWTTHFP